MNILRGMVARCADALQNTDVAIAALYPRKLTLLRQFCKDQTTFVESLLYCPGYTLKQPGTAGSGKVVRDSGAKVD